jgi:L-amino acid N-acyltransferase YncA
VIGVAESMKIEDLNMTEVAFSISEGHQGKKLGSLFLKKLAAAARANGISGLLAYTFPSNKAMISLFKTLPYKVKSRYEDGDVVLTCKFNELA